MKSLLIFASILTPTLCQAAAILMQAPGASPVEYQKVLQQQSHFVSYVESRVEIHQSNVGQEDRIYSFADEIPFSSARFLQNIKELRRESPLSSTSWNFLADFLPRLEISTILPSQRVAYQDLLCQAQIFTGKNVFAKCTTETVSLKGLRVHFPQVDTLYVEGRSYSLEDQLPLPKNSELHWILLSNSYQEIHFWGSYEQLRRQQFKFEELVSGNCDSFKMNENSFEIATRGSVFFSADCLRKSSEPTKKQAWTEKHKSWLIPVGAAVVGVLLYQTKDNPIMIDMPSFR